MTGIHADGTEFKRAGLLGVVDRVLIPDIVADARGVCTIGSVFLTRFLFKKIDLRYQSDAGIPDMRRNFRSGLPWKK
jgi:hypothetical protein